MIRMWFCSWLVDWLMICVHFTVINMTHILMRRWEKSSPTQDLNCENTLKWPHSVHHIFYGIHNMSSSRTLPSLLLGVHRDQLTPKLSTSLGPDSSWGPGVHASLCSDKNGCGWGFESSCRCQNFWLMYAKCAAQVWSPALYAGLGFRFSEFSPNN